MGARMLVDRIGGLVFVLIGVGAVWHGYGLDVAFAADPIGPKAFPIIVGLILVVCGACIVIRPEEIVWEAGDYGRVIAIALASLIYPLLLEPLGFVPATTLLSFVCAKAFKGKTVASLVGAIAIAMIVFVLIDLVLGLGLQRGPLGI